MTERELKLTKNQYLTIEEQEKLLNYWERKARRARIEGKVRDRKTWLTLKLMLGTGIRTSEAIQLRIGDLKLSGAEPYIQVTSTKSGKKRRIFLSRQLAAIFKEEIKHRKQNKDAFLLASERGSGGITRQGLTRIWKTALQKAGIPSRKLHAARHSYGYWLYKITGDLDTVQEQLGHVSKSYTYLYTNVEI